MNNPMIGSLIAVEIVGHALFVNGPVCLDESRNPRRQTNQSAPTNIAD